MSSVTLPNSIVGGKNYKPVQEAAENLKQQIRDLFVAAKIRDIDDDLEPLNRMLNDLFDKHDIKLK